MRRLYQPRHLFLHVRTLQYNSVAHNADCGCLCLSAKVMTSTQQNQPPPPASLTQAKTTNKSDGKTGQKSAIKATPNNGIYITSDKPTAK